MLRVEKLSEQGSVRGRVPTPRGYPVPLTNLLVWAPSCGRAARWRPRENVSGLTAPEPLFLKLSRQLLRQHEESNYLC